MNIIGKKLSTGELLLVKGGCDIDCYCGSLETIIYGDNDQATIDAAGDAWDAHNCPTGNPGDPGYPGSGIYPQ